MIYRFDFITTDCRTRCVDRQIGLPEGTTRYLSRLIRPFDRQIRLSRIQTRNLPLWIRERRI